MFTKKKKKTMRMLVSKIKFINFVKFFADALYTPFLILYLKDIGYNGFQLGILLAIVPLFNILGNILLSFFANSFKKNKIILSTLLFVFGLGLLLLIFGKSNYFLTLLSVGMISIANGPSFNLEEGINALYVEKEKANYAFTRMFGSIGYLVALFILFFIPTNFDYKMIFLISSILMLILGVIWIFLPNLENEIKEKAKLIDLLKNKQFIIYFLMYFLFFGAFNSFDYYIPDYILNNGFTKNEYSLFFAFAVLVELFVIVIVGKLAKEKNYRFFLLFALGFLSLRSACFLIPNLNHYLIPVLMITRGIGWGTFLAVHIKLLMTFLNKMQKAIGILVLCVGQGIVASVLNMIGSTIIENSSYQIFFLLIVGLMTVSFVFYLVYNFIYAIRKKKLKNGNENKRRSIKCLEK